MPTLSYFLVFKYLSRDDADRVVKDLDDKELRGHVALDDSVRVDK
jgi:hypothetical protein